MTTTSTMTTSIAATTAVTNIVHGTKCKSNDSNDIQQQQVQQQVQQQQEQDTTTKTTTTNNDNNTEETEEECPICCNSMTIGDTQYPLLCPTKSCYYNYCSNCIQNFINAASDGYQLASDGSYQMKITVKCPMCRSKYQIATNTSQQQQQQQQSHGVENNSKEQHQQQHVSDSNKIVQSIILLRNATQMEVLLQSDDSMLNASQLAKRDEYKRTITIDMLDDAYSTIQQYNKSLQSTSHKYETKNIDYHHIQRDLTVRPYNSTLFRSVLQPNSKDHRLSDRTTGTNSNTDISQELLKNNINSSTNTTTTGSTIQSFNNNNNNYTTSTNTIAWKDPTMLGGLEELMTVSEHEFITSMMISGQTETIAQAASILHGILQMSTTRRIVAPVQVPKVSQNSCPGNTTNTNRKTTTNNAPSSNRPVRLSVRDIEHINRIKRRFPLPINMPRCVTVPVYDALLLEVDCKSSSNNKQQTPVFNFATDSTDKTKITLQLKNVNGYAGKVGLRKNDIITHIDNIAIDTYDEFITIMSCRYNNHSCSEFNTYETQSFGQQCQGQGGGGQQQQQQMPTVEIVVNATYDVANSLQQRYYQMQKEKIRFLYN